MSSLERFRLSLVQDPGSVVSQANLGLILKQAGDLDAAIRAYRRALLLAPGHAQIHTNLGSALQQAGNAAEAERSYRRAIILTPPSAGALFNLGSLLRDQGRIGEAPPGFYRALRLEPGHPDLHGGLAVLEQYGERLDRAIPGYRRAVTLQPDRADFYINLGNGLRQAGQLVEAETVYRRALALAPDQGDGQFNLGLLLLTLGRLKEGWPGYEYRWETAQLRHQRRSFPQPMWQGEAAPGKTVLLHAEQGFGDTLHFCRYAALVKERGLKVVLEVQPPLLRLVGSLAGCDQVIARGDPLPHFDFHCPLLSLPLALGSDAIPARIPYLHPEQAADLPGPGLRIGLVWAGAPRRDSPAQAAFDRRRSLSPAALAPILAVPGKRFFSLQKDGPAVPGVTDLMAGVTDFADTAAIVAGLDLVISVDTAVAHLAGALGKPVWLLNRFDSDWRWLVEGETTPWYPTMRIFRQRSPGDWDGVIAEVRSALSP